jgi:hypothetical protein
MAVQGNLLALSATSIGRTETHVALHNPRRMLTLSYPALLAKDNLKQERKQKM